MAYQQMVATLLLIAMMCGCENKNADTGQVFGTVTLAGKPLAGGSVIFENREKGVAVHAQLNEAGEFRVQTFDRLGLPAGDYQIAVRLDKFTLEGSEPLVQNPNTIAALQSVEIPERYRNIETSGLTTTVEVGENPPVEIQLVE